MEWLCGLAVVVLIVAVVGHGLWVLIATIFNGLLGTGKPETDQPRFRPFTRCPSCRAEFQPRDIECFNCGLKLDSRTAHLLGRVRAAEAEMRGLAESGDLDPETSRSVLARLEQRVRVLQGLPTDRPPPAHAPEAETAVVPKAALPVSESEPVPATPSPAPATVAPAEPTRASAAPEPAQPRHGSVLTSFMEERNILWGELVGGLLIVGCSIALVVTLWQRLEAIPYFPFLLSAAVTLALYGAGQYTLHHWKLESTSRGLLVISLLLAPLNLLLLAEPIARAEVAVPFDFVMKLGAVALFAWMVRGGARDVLTPRPGWRWLAALAVVGAPATQLLPAAWFAEWSAGVPPWLALGCFVVAVALALRSSQGGRDEPLSRDAGIALLQFVGFAAFALAAAWGLHAARSPDSPERVRGLALPLALAAMPFVQAGFLVQRRVREGGIRATGTGVALAGFVLMTGALAAAWPEPRHVLLVSSVAGLFLTRVAFRESLPWAHAGAIPLLALAAVIGYYGIAGRWGEPLAELLRNADSGVVLVGFALLLAGIAELLARRGVRAHAVSYALAGVAAGFTGLLISTVNGPEYPVHAAAAHLACAFGLLATNHRWWLRVSAHGGLWLVLVATLWAMHAVYPGEFERWGFAISLESLAFAGLALLLKGYREGATGLLRRAGRDVSIAAAILAPALSLAVGRLPDSAWTAGSLFTLTSTGLALARLTGRALPTYLGCVTAFLGVIHLTAFTFDGQPAHRPYLVGMLALSTVATLAAILLRRQERVFALPLRRSAQVVSGIAALFVLVPPAALAAEWAACAAWLGLVWLVLALVWRERGAFSVFQIALTGATVLLGVAWVNAQDWRPETSLGYFEPAALHAYSVAVAILGMCWVIARRLLSSNRTASQLWIHQKWSAERVALAVVVVAQLLIVALAILPEVKAELAPLGWNHLRGQPVALVQAFGTGAWILLGVLATVLIASWRLNGTERDTNSHVFGLALLFLTLPVVWAGSHAADLASATALRWGLGLAFVVGTTAVVARRPLRAGLERAGFAVHFAPFTRPALLALLAVAAGVVVVISAQVADIGLSGRKPSGPVAKSAFASMGAIVSNLVPLALVVLGLAATAARERSSGYAFAGGLVFTATLAAGYALGVITAGGRLDAAEQVRVWLLVCGGAAVWALAWLSAERRVPGGPLLAVQIRLGLFGLAGIASFFAIRLIAQPATGLMRAGGEFGQFGWFALSLAGAAGVWQSVRTEPGLKFHAIALTATIAGVLAASAVQPWDAEGTWRSFHTLSLAWVAVGVGLVVAARKRGEASVWLDGFTAVLTIMAIRGAWADPWRPWVPSGLAVVAATLVGTSAVFNRRSVRVVVSGLLVNLAADLLWLPSDAQTASGLLLANAAGLAVAAAVWTLLGLRDPESNWHDFTDLARGIALVLLAFGLAPTLAGNRADSHWLTWSATLAVVASMAAALWVREARIARGGLFAAVAAVVLLGVSETTTFPVWDVWQTPVALAAFGVLVAGIALSVIRAIKPILRLPERGDEWGWLLAAQAGLGAAIVIFGVKTGLTAPDLAGRLASPASVLLLVLASLLLLRAVPTWASVLRFAMAGLCVLTLAASAWAVPDPAGVAPWLQRNAWLFVALAAAGVLGCGFVARVGENWQHAARTIGGISAALAVGVLCVNLVQQIPVYDKKTNHTPLEPAVVFAILLAILALIVLAIRFALRQNLDPLGLRDSRRSVYVYLAELLLVLFFTQIRFNVPEFFLGAAVRYWTFAVMGLAFVGIGLAEYFERRRVNVLAIPLRRTGVLLPLIPLLAFWAKPPAFLTDFANGRAPGLSPFLAYLEKLPQHFDTYAWLWFLAGGVYGVVALSRKSFGWALLAALATNAALWSLLTHHEVPFFVHPQAWVIPLALIVLASEHINRRRLRPDVSNGLRYLGVTMIYVASAADMFIAGVGQSVWLPVVLAVICVAGVLVGIMMRVRAFLFLGVGFLFLDIFAMIWHAAVNLEQTWVWYASGIVLGVAILALFAVFEKRKKKQVEA